MVEVHVAARDRIRPYGPRIRTRVFQRLEQAGLLLDDADVIPTSTSDVEAIRLVRDRRDHVLLIPFHVHDGHDGLSFAQMLARELPLHRNESELEDSGLPDRIRAHLAECAPW